MSSKDIIAILVSLAAVFARYAALVDAWMVHLELTLLLQATNGQEITL